MLINSSKMTTALQCWRKAYNSFVRGFRPEPGFGMIDGSAFHAGVAHGMATKDWDGAIQAAHACFDKELRGKFLLPEEMASQDLHRKLITAMVNCYKEGYGAEDYTIIQPECRFAVDIPGTRHSDPFTHWLELDENYKWVDRWNHYRFINPEAPIEPDCVGEDGKRTHFYHNGERLEYRNDRFDWKKWESGRALPAHSAALHLYLSAGQKIVDEAEEEPYSSAKQCLCYQPHTVRGITDAIVMWKGTVWLHEHKTTGNDNQIFWDEFLLDIQPTIYMWGIWKSTKLRPRGFVINAMVKPAERQVAQWNKSRKYGADKDVTDYVRFARQAYTRTEEDLVRIESQLRDHCNEWLRHLVDNKWPMSNVKGICTMFYRLCEYHGLCMSNDSESEIEQYEQERLVRIEEMRKMREEAQAK